ncbi:nucleoporin [Drechmeria coniospora]|uniref:Nucleoporin n=1 Tax=Drechmeria coniospora TaxID=98403 RepID=A0A151GUA9_DRECN|nr:nucleoporin [Drechmeria coniospora]KYK60699.1 nucleoporin [Drechmeria coniospora]
MISTPRLRSGFPTTPAAAAARRRGADEKTPTSVRSESSTAAAADSTRSPTLPLAPEKLARHSATGEPVIPLTFLDGPQQRLYAFAVYVLLWAWKLYDWLQVVEDGDSSWWLFLKWIFIDFSFLYGLPELRIPWLELSQSVVTAVFLSHLVLNYMLMFNIPLPWQSFLLGLVKILYDRELSISEHSVKVSNILNNHSLIMGRQIINILPEGSAVLNPEHVPYCISPKSKAGVALPIFFNATVPAEIELVRIDLETGKEETINVPGREVGKIAKLIREQSADSHATGFNWQYRVKKPGVYRLSKVLDEYKLEVQSTARNTYVVLCPQARIKPVESSRRCIRDLSDLSLEVYGTPPLKIVYRRTINGKDDSFHFQSLQPDGFTSPLLRSLDNPAVGDGDDISWVRPSKVTVGLNESMTTAGEWDYSVEEVKDAFGNVVKYAEMANDVDHAAPKGLAQKFTVKERPKVRMHGCDLRNPIKVAKGHAAKLPVNFGLSGDISDTSHKVTWKFSPLESLTSNGDHGDSTSMGTYSAKNSRDRPLISEPGLYTLSTVSSGECQGEVDEPSSCLLLNPLEPHLSIKSEDIPDKCAGNSIGLRVDLDLVGTPPFTIRYLIVSDGRVENQAHRVPGLRSQLELIPKTAGRHKYIFKSIDDAVYVGIPLEGSDKILEQVVKPAASAVIANRNREIGACLDSQVEVDVDLYGDPPFNLEWEMVHDGKRKTERAVAVEENRYRIKTAALTKGGEYILALSSIQDSRGCRVFLQDQLKISVRRQRPRGGFGQVEQKNSITAVESDTPLRLPLRLQGEAPWTIHYRNLNGTGDMLTKTATNANDHLLVRSRGVYQIMDVNDKQCPGSVDASASTFKVDWFPRPQMFLVETASTERSDDIFIKQEVCEGDVDGFEVELQGTPPYHVQYDISYKPRQGSSAISHKKFDAALTKASISMDTTKAGDYTYQFSGLADNLYNIDKKSNPLVVQQRVNARPSATFSKPGQSFKYCMEEQEQEDKIPIVLTGVAPFYVEVEIKHQAGSPPELYRIPSINSNSYGMPIPREYLRLGTQQLRVRKVRDARGCQQKYELGAPSIQIQLFDAPSIYSLESRQDFCVGERIAYTLSGTPPFDITYEFNGRWNAKSQTTNFRRIAEKPGEFTITSISDKASECRAAVSLHKTIHPLPSVQISRGKQSRVDIHEGNEVDILFEFWGTPPFEFTYTRSSNVKKGQRSVVLETRHDISHEHTKVVKASQEGTYEVVAIKDKFCSFSTQQVEKREGR